MSVVSYKAAELSQPERFKYLLGSIGPRPICFASTIDKEGNVNLSPFSFFNAFSSTPPILIFSPARNRDGHQKHTYHNIKEVPEVVINMVNYPMVEQQSLASTAFDRGINEFVKSGFTEVKSELVHPPRVKESPASFECKVIEVKDLGNGPGAGSLIICEVLMIHLKSEYFNEKGFPDTTKLDLVGRLGENWYSRASGDALFEVAKPSGSKGIGVDQLPESIRISNVLTGNDLGRLGGIAELPSRDEIELLSKKESWNTINGVKKMHEKAQMHLQNDDVHSAIAILLYADLIE